MPSLLAPGALDRVQLFFVGTATVLLRWGPFTLLTDPNFLHRGEEVHLGYGLRSKRRTEPAVQLGDLPRFDFVLLSHLHEDHFDRKVARELDRGTRIVTTPHAAAALRGRGFHRAHPLRTWESVAFRGNGARLRVVSAPARHGPLLASLALPPTMGSVIELESPLDRVVFRIWVSGDTLVHDRLRQIPLRHPGIDLALLHLGGTRVVGVMVTMDGDEGVRAMRMVEPRLAIPIHYDDYTVFRSPLDEFRRAVDRAGLGEHVSYLSRGDSFEARIPPSRLVAAPPAWAPSPGAPGAHP
jgi:L-ascorbate metabolism protein UlaG (beta-lactamase superfamily)